MRLQDANVLVQLLVKELFSVQNVIKTRHRNHLNTKHLESIMRSALKGPKENFNHILVEAI